MPLLSEQILECMFITFITSNTLRCISSTSTTDLLTFDWDILYPNLYTLQPQTTPPIHVFTVCPLAHDFHGVLGRLKRGRRRIDG